MACSSMALDALHDSKCWLAVVPTQGVSAVFRAPFEPGSSIASRWSERRDPPSTVAPLTAFYEEGMRGFGLVLG